MKRSHSANKNHSSILGVIGIGAATGAFVGLAAVVGYGLVVTKSAVAVLAARTALIGALGGAASSLVMRREQRRIEIALEEKEEQLHEQEEKVSKLKS